MSQPIPLKPNSQNPNGDSNSPETDRRRVPRLMLSHEQFRLKTNGKVFSVTNLSESGFGIRLLDSRDSVLFTVGTHLQGEFKSQEERLSVHATVRHLFVHADGGQIGLEFEKASTELQQFLKARLEPVSIGEALRPMPSPGEYSLWFRGPVGTDLLIDVDPSGRLDRFALFHAGKTVFFENDSLRSGAYDSVPCKEEHRGVVCWDTHEIRFDSGLDERQVRIAKEVILSSKLSGDLNRQIQAVLTPS
jgi:hypothetical protein